MQHGKHDQPPRSRESREPRGWEVEGDFGEWVPVDRATESLLRAAQSNGEVSTEISCGDRRYSIIFRNKGEAERVNLQTKVRRRMRDAALGKDFRCSSVVNTLTNMGFAEEKVRQVLDRTGGDLSKALDELMGRGGTAGGASSSGYRKAGYDDKHRPKALEATTQVPGHANAGHGPLWQVFLRGQWAELDSAAQEVLNQAARKGQNKAVLSTNSTADFVQMVHINTQTGRKRPLRFAGDLEATFDRVDLPNSVRVPGAKAPKAAMPSRYQVFLEGSGWKTMSLKNSSSIEESMKRGKTVFETEDNGHRYRVNLEALTITNLTTGQTTSVRALEDTVSGAPAGSVTQVSQHVVFARYFAALAGSEQARSLTQEAAVSQWLSKALNETSEPKEGRELVLAEAEQLFARLSLARPGVAARDEWIHYWMLDSFAPSHYALKILQDELRKLIRKAPKAVELILALFLEADRDADGEISHTDMGRCCKKCCQNSVDLPLKGAQKWLTRTGTKAEDGTLNYFEFVSELIGRQQHEVWLYQYDISGGLAAWAAPVAMFQSVEGIWHTGVIVYGKEYWYGGQCFESIPESTPFGTPLKRSYLGATLCTQAELWDKMDRELCREYTRESYDVLQHNCNNFSDEVSMFLLNKHIPDEVRLQPQQFTQSLAAQALRPVLNRWLGGFEAETMKGLEGARSSDWVKAEDAWQEIRVGSLVEYSREGLPLLTAEVIAKEEGTCDLWWWEPSGMRHGRFLEAANVSKMQVKDLQRHTGRQCSRRAMAASNSEGCVIC